MSQNKLINLLESLASETSHFPPTILYNEGWLLRIIVDWFATHPVNDHPLTLLEGSTWFSEALLPSAFLARYRGDPLAEASTHVDGVIGHFSIGKTGKADLSLQPDARQFVVLEAKLFSGLAPGVAKARYYDQAARSVACMAEVLCRANRDPANLDGFGFCVLAPASQMDKQMFTEFLDKESIRAKVERRAGEYPGDKDRWFSEWFQPALQRIEIRSISWEELIQAIKKNDKEAGEAIESFYQRCIKYNL